MTFLPISYNPRPESVGSPRDQKRMAGTWLDKFSKITKRPSLRWALFALIVAYLTYQLTQIGWLEIARALPASPLFYLLSLGFILVPVIAEVFAFRTITRSRGPGHFKLFMRKHVLNKAVMNFTGDAFVVHRLSQSTNMSVGHATILMKDMTIIRAFIANFWILALALAAMLAGEFGLLQKIATASPGLVFAVGLLSLTVCAGLVICFKRVTRLPRSVAAKVAGIYLIRSCIIAAILTAQWSIAIPGTPLATWFVFLIVFYVTKKSPIGGEFVFASVIITLPGLGADNAAIAAMLVAMAAVTQALYLAGFLLTTEAKTKSISDAQRG